MAAHVMTPARRAALRKAQLASARKRRKLGTVNHRNGSKTITYMGDSRGRHRPNTGKYKHTIRVTPTKKSTTRGRVKSAAKLVGRFAAYGAITGAVRGGLHGGLAMHSRGENKRGVAVGAAGGALGSGARGAVRWGALGVGVIGAASAVGAVRRRKARKKKRRR